MEERQYRLVSVITEKDPDVRPGFASGLAMLTSGEADVMVVATSAYLPGDWVPRLEVAGDASDPFAIPPDNRPPDPPRQRRARPSRRT